VLGVDLCAFHLSRVGEIFGSGGGALTGGKSSKSGEGKIEVVREKLLGNMRAQKFDFGFVL